MDRRTFVTGALTSPLFAGLAQAQEAAKPTPAPPDLFANGTQFSREALEEYARTLATKGYEAPQGLLPNNFSDLPQEAYRSIRMKADRAPWLGESRGFTLDLLPGGSIYRTPVRLAVIEEGRVKMMPDDPSWFDFGQAPKPPADKPYPFSGFTARFPLEKPNEFRDFANFQGGTIFKALARGQIFGVSSRGLAIDTGEPNGEEFPIFRAFWLERPGTDADTMVAHALLDSRRITGAYRFTIRPGEITVVDVEMTLFPRETLGHVGISPMSSMFLFGPNDRAGTDDIRGEVHRADGLQIWNAAGEWIWRPVNNPTDLQVSVFVDKNPRGFGLLQRRRSFATYNDLGRRYDRMPSLWVEPIGDFGEGQFQLLEIPTDTDINENIVVYWRPKQPFEAGKRISMAYRMHWCWSPPDRPANAYVAETIQGSAGNKRRRFVVDFAGDAVADPAKLAAIRANVVASAGKIREVSGQINPEIKGYRVTFDLDVGNEELIELWLRLEGDAGPMSETWLYRWTP